MTQRPFAIASLLVALLLHATPSLVGQSAWEPIGPTGGRIFDLDMTRSGTLYATSDLQAFVRGTSDTGWRPFTYYDSLSLEFLDNFSIITMENMVMILGPSGKLYVSRDDGVTWRQMDDLPNGNIGFTDPQAFKLRDTIFLVGPEQRSLLMISPDEGRSWSQIATVATESSIASDGLRLFVYNASGLFQRIDGGLTEIGPPNTKVASIVLTGDTLFISGDPGSGVATHFRSHDDGATWTTSSLVPKEVTGLLDGELIAFDDDGVWASGAYGQSWRKVAENTTQQLTWSVVVPFESGLLTPTNQGVFRFDPGVDEGTYSAWNATMYGHRVSDIFAYGDSVFALSAWTFPFAGKPDGSGWYFPDFYLGQRQWCIDPGQAIYMTSETGEHLIRTRDLGATFDTLETLAVTDQIREVYADGNRLVFIDGGRFFHTSADGGENWTVRLIESGPGDLFGEGDTIFCSYVDDGRELLRSFDGGTTWDSVQTPPAARTPFYYSNGTLAVIVRQQLLRSTDLGKTWDTLSVPVEGNTGPAVRNFRQTAILGDTIVASTHTSTLYRSTDVGETWQRLVDPPYPADYLLQYNGSIIAGLSLHSLWRLPLNGMTQSVEENERMIRLLDLW